MLSFFRGTIRSIIRPDICRRFASTPLGTLDRRLAIQYTCKVCDSRQVNYYYYLFFTLLNLRVLKNSQKSLTIPV